MHIFYRFSTLKLSYVADILSHGRRGPAILIIHDDIIKRKHLSRHWSFVRGIHRSPVTSPHKGQWRGALMFSLICAWTNSWVNNRNAGFFIRHRAHYDVTVMSMVNTMADLVTQWAKAGTSNCIPQLLCDVITCPCPNTCFWHPNTDMLWCMWRMVYLRFRLYSVSVWHTKCWSEFNPPYLHQCISK